MMNSRAKKIIFALALVTAPLQVSALDYADGYDAVWSGDYSKAVELFQLLAADGDARAQFNLAMLYHSGNGVQPNEVEAVKWYKRAAEQGVKEAQAYLAVAFEEGWFGLARDLTKAEYWYTRLEES
ncbi:MAG: sel1 repeat family protein [Gammaproteobacteria bacterium]|nr:sel1 repeat family protein [Gammaproteobacteria bacterium]